MATTINLDSLKAGLSKRTIRDQVAERIASMIQSGLLRPEDELPSERELAATLEVSRETVRGAIQMLAAVGMVEISQGSRTRVIGRTDFSGNIIPAEPKLTADMVRLLHEARVLVELQVTRLAVARISTPELRRMRRLVDAQRDMFDDPLNFQISDSQFHHLIYQAADNALLADFLGNLYSQGLQYRRKVLSAAGSIQLSVEDHVRIVEGFEASDAERTAEMVHQHLTRIHETTLQKIVLAQGG